MDRKIIERNDTYSLLTKEYSINTLRQTVNGVIMDICKRFGAKVRALRGARGLSQEELARKAGLHRTYVGGIERGERNISLINIEKLAMALGVSLESLLKGI